jgi:hypothetical protein
MRHPGFSCLPTLLLVLACGGSAATGGSPAPITPTADHGQTAVPEAIDRLLEHARVETIVSARAGAFTRQVALLAEDLTDAELERLVPAVQEAFAPELLRADVRSFIAWEAPDEEMVGEALRMLESGANAEMRRVVDAYEPPLDLQAYMRALLATPPDSDRVDVIVEWTRTQGTGDFYVLLDESLRQAAFEVWATFRPDAPRFQPATGAELQARLVDSFNASVVSFLRAYEPVPDSLLAAATEELASPAGQWYVEAYSLGVAAAMRAAGRRVVAALAGSEG